MHGKLVHAALIFPEGQPYLVNIEVMLSIFDNRPFLPRTPPRGTTDNLNWWTHRLDKPAPPSPIPSPQPIVELNAFSDASSSTGISILLDSRWRAWYLRPNWNWGRRDIGWAERVGFELLVCAILHAGASDIHFKIFGDNMGVVDGWHKGRSRNKPTNDAFKRIHSALARARCTAHAHYIPSASNPANPISRGIYPPLHLLIPSFPIPGDLKYLIVDVTDPDATPSTPTPS